MDRLWIRLSLVFTLVIGIAVAAVGAMARINAAAFMDPQFRPPPEVIAYFEQMQRQLPFDVTTFAIMIGIIAIIAGVAMSRYLTRPLAALEKGAEAISRQDLSYRVPLQGSQEMVAVANAFNEMAAQLEQEEKLRSNLLADVTHELRHPVHILSGNLQAILDGVYPLEKKEIGRLLEQTQHLSVLVNDLYIIAQAEARQLPLQKQQTDIANLIKQAVSSFAARAAEQDVEIRVELLGTVPSAVLIDKARIRQAMHNLLDNSLRHSPPGTTILISIEKTAGSLLIKIQDQGEGIDPKHLPYLFDRFYQTDKARSRQEQSTGLGLAIVKAIIEAHQGQIAVSSPGAGQGTLLTITLPV